MPWEPHRPPSQLRLWPAGRCTGLVATVGRGDPLDAPRAIAAPTRAVEARRGRDRRALGGQLGADEAGAEGRRSTSRSAPTAPSPGPSAASSRFKQIKNALGGTVNDVSLAVAAGAIRRWLQSRDVEVDGLELRALVPVSVRAENEHGELGNMLTAMRGPAPGRDRRPGRAAAHGQPARWTR